MAVSNVELRVDSRQAVNALRDVNRASGQTDSALKGLQRTVAGLASSFAVIQTARFVFAKTAEIESQTRSLQVLTGSVQQAKQIIQELQQLGAVTPFTSTELIDAAKRLQAFGVEGNRVVEVTRRLADASGATGAELQGIVTAYGQVVAKGRLQGEELLQFQERGIGLQQELQKMYNLSGEELQKALSKGRISAEAVEVALQRLTSTGGKYANGAIAQSDTLSGRLSTLQDGIDQLARRIGQVLTPALKAVFNQAIAVVDAINAALSAGRGGGFTRSVAGARQFLNIRATSQAVDNIAKGISQISSQQNRTGIDQNLQALQQYQRLLQSIGPDDPNASRAAQLQGVILQKINQNLDAQKQLNQQTQKGQDIFKTPPLLGGDGGGKGAANKAAREAERAAKLIGASERELSAVKAAFEIEERLSTARREGNDALVATRKAQLNLLEINKRRSDILANKDLPAQAKINELETLQYEAKKISLNLVTQLADLEKKQADEVQRKFEAGQETLQQLIDQEEILRAQIAGNEAEVILKQQLRDITKELTPEQKAQAEATLQNIKALKQQLDVAQQMKDLYADIGTSIKNGVVGAIQGAIDGTKSLEQVASDLLNNIANKLLDVAVNLALFGAISGTGTGGGLLGFLVKPRANGGSVSGGQPYLVGERGPELFMPGRSGGIAPTGSFGGGVNVVVNVDASGTSVQGDQSQGAALGRVVAAAVQAELIKQKRPGGLLTT